MKDEGLFIEDAMRGCIITVRRKDGLNTLSSYNATSLNRQAEKHSTTELDIPLPQTPNKFNKQPHHHPNAPPRRAHHTSPSSSTVRKSILKSDTNYLSVVVAYQVTK